MNKNDTLKTAEVIAIIPAAGTASRLPGISGSKEMIPVGTWLDPVSNQIEPKPVCLHLIEKYQNAGIKKCFIILRKGKWDIPQYFGDGDNFNMDLGYLMMGLPYGTAYTINQAYPYVQNAYVALGFPDILFSPDNSYSRLLKKIKITGADVVLGLFPANKPEKTDMVETSADKHVLNIIIKPKQTDLEFTWGIAVWSPAFSQYLHDYLAMQQTKETDPELHIGHVIQAAINDGMSVIAETVSNKAFLDIGTPDDLSRAIESKEA
jgi:glucose-1-phosphate thymidylyltransferase